MAQVTIEYDGRDITVRKFLEALFTMKSVKIKSSSKLEKLIKESEESGFVAYENYDEFVESMKKELQDV